MTPLAYYTPDDQNFTNNQLTTVSHSSRYDLACITPDQFRRAIADEILQYQHAGYTGPTAFPSQFHLWWNPLIYNLPVTQQYAAVIPTTVSPTVTYYTVPSGLSSSTALYTFSGHNGVTGGTGPNPDLARVAVNPQIQTPLTSAMVAQVAPYLLQHCSQFIVEYAGDYLQQDPASGNLTGIGQDGQIDYYIDGSGNHQIRWYGMPRSNSGASTIYGVPNPSDTNEPWSTYLPNVGTATSPSIAINYRQIATSITQYTYYPGLPDVIPLRDYYTLFYNTVNGTTGNPFIYSPPWEVDVNFDNCAFYANATNPNLGPLANTAGNGLGNPFQMNDSLNPQDNARYVAAWYNDMPAMIRILIKVDDPNDKLKDGPWYEYVFKLK